MEQDGRRKGPRSPSVDSDDSSHRRRSRKYDRDRSPSPRRMRYRRSRSRERRSSSRERRRKESKRSQDWNKSTPQPTTQSATTTATPAANSTYPTAVHNQYQAPALPPNTSQPPPPMPPYNQAYGGYNYSYNQNYDYSYQQATGYRSDYSTANWQAGQVGYNSQPAQAAPLPGQSETNSRPVEPVPGLATAAIPRTEEVTKEAIAAEVKQQQATLAKQREEYVKKFTTLQRELEFLRQQCDEIEKEGGRESIRIIKENHKLQVEIQNKMRSIHNVIDMLTGIIGDKVTVDDLKLRFKEDVLRKLSHSPKDDFTKTKTSDIPEKTTSDTEKDVKACDRERKLSKNVEDESKPMYNFVYYDPEMHWCKICDIFPKTAKEYLNHLHSLEHKENCLEQQIVDMPWHDKNEEDTEKEVPFYRGLPTKRTPIKGLQFFSASTAWYCKLCDSWIGDLHCASLHLKSKRHSENYARFVEQNPHWETDWIADREKAFSEERQKQMQMELQKQKEDDPPPPPPAKPKKSKKSKKNKKKSKKRKNKSSNSDSSSESDNSDTDSDQDTSKSIRVAMRNKIKASTQAILNEDIDYHGIKIKGNWPQNKPAELISQENDDRHLLNSIRDKLKAKQEEEMKQIERKVSVDATEQAEEVEKKFIGKAADTSNLDTWGPKEPPKSFWIKKDDEKTAPVTAKAVDIPKPDDMPKPHMGFWTKQQVNMPVIKPAEKSEKDDDRERERDNRDRDRDRDRDRYRDDRDRKYDRRDDKYHSRYDRYDRRRGGGGGGGEHRDHRDRDYYDERRKDSRRGPDDGSPRRYRDSPRRNYDKYKDRRGDDESNDESKFEKKTNESASKQKKNQVPSKKQTPTGQNKGKLPFIGRLPLFKKKSEETKVGEKDITPLPYVQSKFEDTPKVPSEIINPPGVVHITKLATPVTLNNVTSIPATVKNQPMTILVAPPPPVLNTIPALTTATVAPAVALTQQVVDMEIEDQSEDTIIEEEPIIEQKNQVGGEMDNRTLTSPSFTTAIQNSEMTNPVMFSATQPPPPPPTPASAPPAAFIPTNPPPFVSQNAPRFAVRPPAVNFTHPPPVQGNYVPIPTPVEQQMHSDCVLETPETTKTPATAAGSSSDPSQPLPEDLQEALNIIFPKENAENKDDLQMDHNVMYGSMYNSMLGCVGYGPEYMDQPPPEITQAEPETDGQPGPDDLRMLGIDEGDTIL